MRAQLGELALVLARVGVVELVSDDQAKNGIAEELHALVRLPSVVRIFVEVGAVDKRLLQEGGILELHAQALPKRASCSQLGHPLDRKDAAAANAAVAVAQRLSLPNGETD
jgi:hypothetical protein